MSIAALGASELRPRTWTTQRPRDEREEAMLRLSGEAAPDADVRGGPRRWAYAALGMALALGAPAGFMIVEAIEAGQMSLSWMRDDLARNLHEYVYVLCSTMVVFATFGYVLGRWQDQLVALASTDPLTGLNNARLLRARLEDEFARSVRYGIPLSLLLLDLDDLKLINDRSGHRAGDGALKAVAAALLGGSRAPDVVARWGGDEFALLAPHTEEAAAALLGERIRSAVALAGSYGEAVTVSLGVATVAGAGSIDSPDALIATADAALYQAKRSGKNSLVVGSVGNAQNTYNAQSMHITQGRRGRLNGEGGC